MKIILSTLVSFCFSLAGFSQETYTARKGLRIFPGHLHIALKVDSNKVHYQLFNHWYNLSYAQYRDIKIPISELPQYGEQNDTLRIIILADKVKLVDKRNQLDLKIKHTKLCSTVETMRKISYAHSVADKHGSIRHFHLYTQKDLDLPEAAFKLLVNKNLEKEIK